MADIITIIAIFFICLMAFIGAVISGNWLGDKYNKRKARKNDK